MLRSRQIGDYVECKISDLRPGVAIAFDIHIYFPANCHIMIWRKNGEMLTDGFIDRYRSRGLENVYIHNSDADALNLYLNPPGETQDAQDTEDRRSAHVHSGQDGLGSGQDGTHPDPAHTLGHGDAEHGSSKKSGSLPSHDRGEAPARPKTEQGSRIADLIKTATLESPLNIARAAKEAREVLAQTASADTLSDQVGKLDQARKVVQDILTETCTEAESLVSEIWRLSNLDADLEHAVNVATYSVIFAMAFGRIDSALMQDLALAALLHDIGLSQIPAHIVQTSWKTMRHDDRVEYAQHVQAGLELIDTYSPDLPPRVKAILHQHHEKFDGTGYPQKLQGFRVDDISQLLAIADLLDSIASGQWDGTARTLKDTFGVLEKLEKARTFPEHFNPEVFAAVLRWIRDPASTQTSKTAVQTVESQARGLLSDDKAS